MTSVFSVWIMEEELWRDRCVYAHAGTIGYKAFKEVLEWYLL
uniref:Uncharacterized protein n=1 Tax=Arundo donax TaxID=35708 RepID=A0A0A8YAF1_ARUDO